MYIKHRFFIRHLRNDLNCAWKLIFEAPSRAMKYFSFISLLTIFLSLGCSTEARDISWYDIRSAKKAITILRDNMTFSGKFQSSSKFMTDFIRGSSYKRRTKYKKAIISFAQAAFENSKQIPKTYRLKSIKEFLKKKKKVSPLHSYAILLIAECYIALKHVSDPLYILSVIEETKEPYIIERSLELKAMLLMKSKPDQALEALNKLIKMEPKATWYIRIAAIFKQKGDAQSANKNFKKSLAFYKIDWALKVAMKSLLKSSNHSDILPSLSNKEKLGFAIYYTGRGKYKIALNALKSIKSRSFSKEAAITYHKYLLINLIRLSKKQKSISILRQNPEKLSETFIREWYRKGQYTLIERYASDHALGVSSDRLLIRALMKLNNSKAIKLMKQALQQYSYHSRKIEKEFFTHCLSYLEKELWHDSITCLQNLRAATKNLSLGGRARYYLAKLLQRKGQTQAARLTFREIYLNSPQSSYVFKGLKQGLAIKSMTDLPDNIDEIRNWIALYGGNPKALAKYYKRKKNEDSYGIDPFWIKWEKKLEDLESSTSQKEFQAILLIASGQSKIGHALLSNTEEYRKLYLITKLGFAVNDAHIKHHYTRKLLRKKNIQEDIFLMSPLAQAALYPKPHLTVVKRETKKYGIRPEEIYALMRQESRYYSQATSRSNAKGLMQMLPSTGRYVNQKVRIPNMDLYNPNHNIILSVRFFAILKRQFKGDFEQIAGAYNGGPSRMNRWKKKLGFSNRELFFEKIPYFETHLYVKITKANLDRYLLLKTYFD